MAAVDQPLWGVSGPDFLLGYLVAAVVLIGVALGPVPLLRRTRPARTGDGVVPSADDPMTAEQLAYLAGGRRRVVEVVLVGLVERGLLRVRRGGIVTRTNRDEPVGPLDRAVIDAAVRGSGSKRRAWSAFEGAAAGTAVRAVEHRVRARGWILPPTLVRMSIRCSALPVIALGLLGMWRALAGDAAGHASGFITVLGVLTTAFGGVLWQRRPVAVTVEGREALRSGRAAVAVTTAPPAWLHPGLVGAVATVALDGIAAHPDSALRDQFVAGGVGSGGFGGGCGGCGSGGGGGGGCGG